MSNITVDFNKQIGVLKPVHGVGAPPFVGLNFEKFEFLKKAGIPFSRLHDVGVLNEHMVDIHRVFPNFDADAENPDSYDFTFTDLLIKNLIENNVEPFIRLGETIENARKIKAYYIYPPKDNLKWAKICEGIIRHYTEGWADGFTYNINYWEIWNEPDNEEDIAKNPCWLGTKEEFYELYNIASKYLKSKFPHLKIGGYGSCGFYALGSETPAFANSSSWTGYFLEFFEGFLKYVKENNCPFDFFTWHSYGNITDTVNYAKYSRKYLDDMGFYDVETICNEWNCSPRKRGTSEHAALIGGMLIGMQNSPLTSAMFYDARLTVSFYGGLFNPLTQTPFLSYYSFVAFNDLYQLKNQFDISSDNPNIHALAANDGKNKRIMLVNTSGDDIEIDINGFDDKVSCKVANSENMWEVCDCLQKIKGYTVMVISNTEY